MVVERPTLHKIFEDSDVMDPTLIVLYTLFNSVYFRFSTQLTKCRLFSFFLNKQVRSVLRSWLRNFLSKSKAKDKRFYVKA